MVGSPGAEQAATTADQMDWIELERCPVCGSPDCSHFETLRQNGENVVYQLCRNCGTVYQSPRMSDAALDAYYRAEYVAQHQRAESVTEKELRVQSGRARNLLELLAPSLSRVERHLDIGSSAGVLLESVRTAYGCEAVGVEPSELYRRFAFGLGLQVYRSLDALATEDARPFDLITMAHVLEHLPDPVGYLHELREGWLTSEGRLLVEVPNLFGHFSFERPHLFCFHAGTLRRVLAAAGLDTVGLTIHGAPRSRLIPLYLTAIARPAQRSGPPRLRSSAAGMRLRSSAAGMRLRRVLGIAWHRFASRFLTRWAWLPLPELWSQV